MTTRPTPDWTTRLARYPLQQVATAGGVLGWRAAGPANAAHTLVLLHGIGSASASWVAQLDQAEAAGCRVLAWDAPGYGPSAPVGTTGAAWPVAADYARRLWAWLDALGLHQPVRLAGHSLGALVATQAACQQPARVQALTLLAPARGYGDAPEAERQKKLQDRLEALHTLGPAGMAARRSAAMLSPQAPQALRDTIQSIMAQVLPEGYTRAAQLLAGGRLLADLAALRAAAPALPLAVASGQADTITPVAACQAVALAAGVPWGDLGAVGHACPLEAAAAVNHLLGLLP